MKRIRSNKKIKVQSTRLLKRNIIILFCLTLLLSPFGNGLVGNVGQVQAAGTFAGGSGTESDPYQIETAEELNEVRNHLENHFILIADIDLDVDPYNTGPGWQPIGENGSPFTGSFNGNEKIISNLKIDRDDEDYVGLFGMVSGNIGGLTLTDVDIKGKGFVGSLAGRSSSGSVITHINSSGVVKGTGDRIGGLVGSHEGEIEDSVMTGQVTGEDRVGGLVGVNFGGVVGSSATGAVSGATFVGGLVGYSDGNSSPITNSHSQGNVSGTGNTVGGLVGSLFGSIEDSSATGEVNGASELGGLVGILSGDGSIAHSNSTGNVEGTGYYVGGLVGLSGSNTSITNSDASGDVGGTGNGVGGLVGLHKGKIEGSLATGQVEGEEDVGGLVGNQYEDSEIISTYATGTVTSDGYAGGLIGNNEEGTIKNSYATGAVTTTGDASRAGGLIGGVVPGSNIINSFYDSDTTGQTDDDGRGTPKPTADMKQQGTFTGWDFTNVWGMPANDYPRLLWEQPPVAGGDVTAIYVDESDNEIASEIVKTGNIGDAYTTDEKQITGYTFKEVIGDATGTFTADPQEVIYVYMKDPVAGGDVTAVYIDESDNEIASEIVKTGNIGDAYTTDEKQITGYTFKEVIGDATGTFTADPQEVIYVYTKDDVVAPTFTVTVTHVDEDGNDLVSDIILTGELDAPYTTEAEEIDGYTLTDTPSNATGTFGSMDIEVVYVYSKDQEDLEVPTFTVTVTHVNEDGNTLVPETILTGELDAPYTTEAEEIDGYTLTDTPSNATGTFGSTDIEVTYVYKQDEKPKEDLVGTPEAKSGDDSTTNKLPKTATPYYTILFAGLLLILIGGAVYIVARKKRIV